MRHPSPQAALPALRLRFFLLIAVLILVSIAQVRAQSFSEVVRAVQPRMVKIYGAGGVRGLESYQSGFLISPEGHVLTVWSYVLDTDLVMAVLDDGRKFQAELVGADPSLEIAVVKIDAGEELPYYSLADSVELTPGGRVLAFSNLFGVAAGDEQASVLHGVVTARMKLQARRGAFETPYRGEAYVIDAMTNNPGAAGGALTDRRGRLAGLLGKELRNALDNTWLNYAVPAEELRDSIKAILEGKQRPQAAASERKPLEPVSPTLLGIRLVPDLLSKTPPFIDQVADGSPAQSAGLKADDVVLFVNGQFVRSVKEVREAMSYIDRIDEVQLTVQRGQKLLEVALFVDN